MEEFLNARDIAKILRISRVSVYKLVQQKRIPFYRVETKCVRFFPSEIQKWLEEKRNKEWHRDKA